MKNFYMNLENYGKRVAVFEASTGREITYKGLSELVVEFRNKLGSERKLIFLEAKNNIDTVCAYLACLQGGHPVYLTQDNDSDQVKALIELYQPNILISTDPCLKIEDRKANIHEFHPNLRLLLSTSGSTGTPKFVKLSETNICSNADAISNYLNLNKFDKALAHLKLHYSYGLSVLNSHLAVGASVVLSDVSVTDSLFNKILKQYDITSFAGVPYTFESLLHSRFDFSEYPALRYVTQAGGKLEPGLVKTYVQFCKQNKIDFYVMYGQTEASPRISYLPPDRAEQNPEAIGIAIPGGHLEIRNQEGELISQSNVPGELVYRGPNVMMGYATSSNELSEDSTPEFLKTGDVACVNDEGLFYIVGRTSRFIKPFGIRINLDEIQSYIKKYFLEGVCSGTDSLIVIALEKSIERNNIDFLSNISNYFKLPQSIFYVWYCDSIPLLSNGKFNYQAIVKSALEEKNEVKPSGKYDLFKGWWSRIVSESLDILEISSNGYSSIKDLYSDVLSVKNMSDECSFNQLNPDSLSYVEVSVQLEDLFGGDVPKDWQQRSVKDLQDLLDKTLVEQF